jgi:hypothetical protein
MSHYRFPLAALRREIHAVLGAEAIAEAIREEAAAIREQEDNNE